MLIMYIKTSFDRILICFQDHYSKSLLPLIRIFSDLKHCLKSRNENYLRLILKIFKQEWRKSECLLGGILVVQINNSLDSCLFYLFEDEKKFTGCSRFTTLKFIVYKIYV